MNQSEWDAASNKLMSLWPKWNPTAAVLGGWQRIVGGFRYEVLVRAIDAHWEDNADKWEPSHKAIKKLAMDFAPNTQTPEQAEYETRFYAMSKLDQNREMARSHWLQAQRASNEWEHDKHMATFDLANIYIKRLGPKQYEEGGA
jgi:hypothetical protein